MSFFSNFFIGKPIHWVFLLVACGLVVWAGSNKFHVLYFNSFVLVLFGVTALTIIGILKTTGPGEQVTREPIDKGLN